MTTSTCVSTCLFLILIGAFFQGIRGRVDDREKDRLENTDDHKQRHHKWDYSSKGKNWKEMEHTHCSGKGQSPIQISTKNAVLAPFPALEMVGYHNSLPAPVVLANNGHSVSLTPTRPDAEKVDEIMPYIFGGPLKGPYEMVGLHFHWGRRNNRGSEHIINSIRFAMELHIIHKNEKYGTVEEALKHRDGLSVLAFFFMAGERGNARLDPFIQRLPLVQSKGEKMNLGQPMFLSWMLPRDIDTFYSYRGSLTTPPCSEAVTWILFPSPIHISFDQMEVFRKLSFGESPMVDNFRAPQPIGGRTIFVHRIVNGTRFHSRRPY